MPAGWVWTRLGNIGSWGSGATPSKGHPEYYSNGTIPWLTTGELNDGVVYDTRTKVSQKALDNCSLRVCHIGDILIAMYGATIGKVAIAGCELTTNQACCACTPFYEYNKYLFYYLMANKVVFNQMGEGGAQPNISKEKIVGFLFALPPIQEQKRIVEKIELVLPRIDKYGRSQEALNRLNNNVLPLLRKSILQDAIQGRLTSQDQNDQPSSILLDQIRAEKQKLLKEGKLKKKDIVESIIFKGEDNKYYEKIGNKCLDINEEVPFDIPESWVWVRLASIANLYTGNSISETEKRVRYTNVAGKKYIGTKDVGFDHSINYDNGVAIPAKYLPDFRIAPSGSVLMCIEGGSAGRKIAILEKDVCFGNKLCCFAPYAEIAQYIYYYLQSPTFFDVFQRNKTGIIGGVSVNTLKDLLIALPPKDEQIRIVAKIQSLKL